MGYRCYPIKYDLYLGFQPRVTNINHSFFTAETLLTYYKSFHDLYQSSVTKMTQFCQNMVIRESKNSTHYVKTSMTCADFRTFFVFNESETLHRNKSFNHKEFFSYETFEFFFHFYGECNSMAESFYGESPPHTGQAYVGKAYFGKAFAIENEEKKKASLPRPEQMADLVQKMTYTKMILDRLRQYKSLELKSLGKK